jgi:hypothetical protein
MQAEARESDEGGLSAEVTEQLEAIRSENEKRLQRMKTKLKSEARERKSLLKQKARLETQLRKQEDAHTALQANLAKRTRQAHSSRRLQKKFSLATQVRCSLQCGGVCPWVYRCV